VTSFAVDVFTRMTFDGIVPNEEDGALGQEVSQEKSAQGTSQLESRPPSRREDPLRGSAMSRGPWAEGSQEVGDSTPSSGENRTNEYGLSQKICDSFS
jgi:hypothetical protein